jgi:hypothetical protein
MGNQTSQQSSEEQPSAPSQNLAPTDAGWSTQVNATLTYLQTVAKDLKDDAREQKSYMVLGFFILAAMFIALLAVFTSEKVTADYELTHSIDLLQMQMASSTRGN